MGKGRYNTKSEYYFNSHSTTNRKISGSLNQITTACREITKVKRCQSQCMQLGCWHCHCQFILFQSMNYTVKVRDSLMVSLVDYNNYIHEFSLIASEPWPTSCIFIQQESPVFINYHIASNSTGTQHQFSTRQYLHVINPLIINHGILWNPRP